MYKSNKDRIKNISKRLIINKENILSINK